MKPNPTHRAAAAAVSVIAIFGLTSFLEANLKTDAETPEALIQRVVTQTTRSGIAIRATREMRAGTRSGKHMGWMSIETTLSSSGVFNWTIVDEGGSERTRSKVFRALLESESDTWRAGARDAAALTPANYRFGPLPGGRPGQVQIRLTPKRQDPKLIDGVLTVSADGYPMLLEGTLAKSPSFWVKSVRVVKRFGRFAGVALPTTLESTADLKMFGESTFTMQYRYSEVNGRPISHAMASIAP